MEIAYVELYVNNFNRCVFIFISIDARGKKERDNDVCFLIVPSLILEKWAVSFVVVEGGGGGGGRELDYRNTVN